MRLSVSRRKKQQGSRPEDLPRVGAFISRDIQTVEKFSKKLQIVQEIFLVVRFIRWYHDIDLRS